MSNERTNYLCNYEHYTLHYKPFILSGLYEVLIGMRTILGSEDDSLITCAVDRILCHLDRLKPASGEVLISTHLLNDIMFELKRAYEGTCWFSYNSFVYKMAEDPNEDLCGESFPKNDWFENMGGFLYKLDLLYFQLTHDIIRDKMTIRNTEKDGIVMVEGNCVREETSNQKK